MEPHLYTEAAAETVLTVELESRGQSAALGAEWDAFLAHASGGEIVQTSGWAEVKRRSGMTSFLTVVRRGDRVVAGALMLTRAFPVIGRVGYVPYGPVYEPGDLDQAITTLKAVEACMRAEHIRALIVQPSVGAEEVSTILDAWRCPLSPVDVAPPATFRLRFSGIGDIEAQLEHHVRRHVRRAEHAGVTFRELELNEIELFYDLHRTSAEQQGFEPMPLERLREEVGILGPLGHARIFLAEREGEPLAGVLVTGFAQTVTAKVAGLTSGRKHYASELLYAQLMRWAAREGFSEYDFGGVPRGYAADLIAGVEPGECPQRGAAEFKRGFGGAPVVFPAAYVIIPSRPVRAIFRWFANHEAAMRRAETLVNRLRRI